MAAIGRWNRDIVDFIILSSSFLLLIRLNKSTSCPCSRSAPSELGRNHTILSASTIRTRQRNVRKTTLNSLNLEKIRQMSLSLRKRSWVRVDIPWRKIRFTCCSGSTRIGKRGHLLRSAGCSILLPDSSGKLENVASFCCEKAI